MLADVRRWGNSLAIRIPAEEALALGIQEGDRVTARLRRVPTAGQKVRLDGLPTFHDPTWTSANLDEVLGEAVEAHWEAKRRRG